MKCSDFHSIVRKVKEHEQLELAAAVKAHGGEFDFTQHCGEDCEPIIAVNMDSWEPEPQDVIVKRVILDDGDLRLMCEGKLDGEDYKVDPDDVFAGHIDYVICAIPPINGIDDVTVPFEF